MQLWTDYEGTTIDGAFPLTKLLLPQGRSAFFSTANGKGEPVLIRLIECHFDDEEILGRWRGIEALNHPNFLKLERYGKLLQDDVTVVYAVFERAEANLAQVLRERRLTFAETMQLAASMSAALETLHVNGFVHEHIDPANVFAVGEVVKLRTDCIRETPEDERGVEAKSADIHDLAVLLLQALTQRWTLETDGDGTSLPSPFDEIVLNGISGAWGLAEIKDALQSAARPSRPTEAHAPQPAPALPETKTEIRTDEPTIRLKNNVIEEPLPLEDWVIGRTMRARWIGASVLAAVVSIVVLMLLWHFARRPTAIAENTEKSTPVLRAKPTASLGRAASLRGQAGTANASPTPKATRASASVETRAQWRVVAYTYNREDQARKKSAAIAQKHPELRAQVFTPTGHKPFLVTVGGTMSKDEAYALAARIRQMGLSRDTYAQNYSGGR